MTDAYHQQVLAQLDEARAELAQLHEGEEPHLDERIEATPAQWIWHWNRATPAIRLEVITEIKGALDRADRCFMGRHEGQIADLRQRLADEHRTSADRATEVHNVRRLLRAAEDELAVHRQRAATRPIETTELPHRDTLFVKKVPFPYAELQPTHEEQQARVGAILDAASSRAEPELTVRMMTPPLPACPDCRQPRHAGFTCDETDTLASAVGRAFAEAYERMKGPHLGAAFTSPPPGP